MAADPPIRFRALVMALVMTGALQACVGPEPERGGGSPRSALVLSRVSLDRSAALAEVNAYRAANGQGALRLDPALDTLAQRQAEAMAAAGVVSHDVAGSLTSRLATTRFANVAAAENVAAGTSSFPETLAGWRASAGHNANLLMPDAALTGFGLAKNPATRYGASWAMAVASEPRAAAATPELMFGGCWPLCR